MQKQLEELKKQLGESKVFRASEAPEVEVISTGVASLDFATGVGGIPRGTVVEVFGRESSGKSTLLYYLIAEVQKKGGFAALIDIEGTFDGPWAQKVAGVNLDDLLVVSPNPGTEAVETLARLVTATDDTGKGVFDLVGFDSVGAMLTDKEQEVGSTKQAGGQSGLVTHMVKQIALPARRNKTSVVFLNHVRDVFDSMYAMEEGPGGHAIKHMAVMRIHLKPSMAKKFTKEAVIDGESIQVMHRVNAKIKKNKAGAPNRVASWNFWNYESEDGIIGIDTQQSFIDTALQQGLIDRKGAWYQHPLFPGEKHQLQGEKAVSEFLKSRPEVLDELKQQLARLAFAQGSTPVRDTLG